MDQLKKLIQSLPVRQRILIVVTAVLVAAGLYSFSTWRHEQDFKPLFTGVAPEDAASVIQKLKEASVEYKLGGDSGSTILVPSAKVSELRLEMASAGLPKSGRAGFELFDKTNLGTTDFAEHINYARAVEGELERSIRHIQEIEQARVHITFPKDSVFVESRQPAKASVLLSLKPGAKISQQNVLAICHLVASAVEGLDPQSVSILDTRGSLLNRPKRQNGEARLPDETLEYREKLERELVSKINNTLDPLLGVEKFRASVALDLELKSGEESSEIYDPEKTVMLNTTKTEESSGPSPVPVGVPGAASALPRAPGAGSGRNSSTNRRSETVVYQPSKTVRHTRIPQGEVKRMSVALLLDQPVRWEPNGKEQKRVVVPHSPETLKSIRDVVAASIALNTERGDQLVVESLPFEQTLALPAPVSDPQAPAAGQFTIPGFGAVDQKIVAAAGVAIVVLLLLLLFVASKLLKRFKKKPTVVPAAVPELPVAPDTKQLAAVETEALAKMIEEQAAANKRALAEAQEKLKAEQNRSQRSAVLISVLQDSVKRDAATSASVMKDWINED